MYKLLLIWIVTMSIILQGFSQSTLQELASISDTETKVDTLLNISWRFLETNFNWEASKPYAKKALELSKKLNYSLGIAESYVHLGIITQYIDADFYAAEHYFQEAYSIREQEKQDLKAASALINLINLYSEYGKLTEAENVAKVGLNLIQSYDNHQEAMNLGSKIHHSLGIIYREKGDLEKAIQQLEATLAIRKNLNKKTDIVQSYLSLGNFYSEDAIKNYPKAKDFFSKGLKLVIQQGDTIHYAKILIGLGKVELEQENLKDALSYFTTTRLLGDKVLIEDKILASQYIGILYFQKGQTQKALNEWLSIENNSIELLDSFDLTYLLTDIGIAYDQLSNTQKAFDYLNRANDIAALLDYQPLRLITLKHLVNYHHRQGNFQQAFELDKIVENIQDSVTTLAQDAINYKADLEEQGKEKAQIENVALKLEKQSLLLKGLGLIALLLLIAVGFAFYAYRNKKNQELAWQETDSIIREQELKLAYARLDGRNDERERIARDLHDGLGGMLSSVKLQLGTVEKKIGVLEDDVSKQLDVVTELLDESFDEVRRISHNMMSSSLEKLGLRFIVEQFAEQIKHSKQIEVNVDTHDMDERLDKFLEVGLYRIFQEIMRNILKHAKTERIDIQLNRFDDTINLMVEDTGVGFNVETTKAKHKGIGLTNIQKRVNELGGNLSIDSTIGRGTTVMIDIPVKETYE